MNSLIKSQKETLLSQLVSHLMQLKRLILVRFVLKRVKQISITDSQISPLLAFSDIAFVIKEAQVLGFRSQCSTMTLVQTLAIVLGLEKKKIKTPNNKNAPRWGILHYNY